MSYITLYTKKELESVGFSFPDYENFMNHRMIYAYKHDEYVIGGFCMSDYTEMDKRISKDGEWLPDSHQLLQWLRQCGFDVSIEWKSEESRFYLSAMRSEGEQYKARNISLANGLAKLIYKICKSTQGQCKPDRLFRLEILPDKDV